MSLLSHNWLVKRIAADHISNAIKRWGRGHTVDVGCGNMPYAHLFGKYTGVELDFLRYETMPPDICGSALDLPITDVSVDTVFSSQVLEHVTEPWRMIAEMARILKPEGYFILTAPHIWGLHEVPRDYYRFTPHGLQFLVERVGLEMIEVLPMAGYWVTAGARFCYYLRRFQKRFFGPLLRPLYTIVQISSFILDRLHRVDTDAWNYIIVAKKPRVNS